MSIKKEAKIKVWHDFLQKTNLNQNRIQNLHGPSSKKPCCPKQAKEMRKNKIDLGIRLEFSEWSLSILFSILDFSTEINKEMESATECVTDLD